MIFALAAQRALEPASKLAATRWVAERVFIEDCPGFSDDQTYRAMDFLLEEIAAGIFWPAAHLLNLGVGIVFVDTTSTYREMDAAAGLAEIAGDDGRGEDVGKPPGEEGARRFGHSKDHRDDLPQVVIAMAVTRDGIPVRCWTFPGNEQGQKIIRRSRTTWARGTCAAWCESPTAGSPPPPTAPASPGRRALHPRREAPQHQRRGRRGAGPPGPLPPSRREPAGQGGLGAPQGRRGTIRAVHQRLVLRQQLVDVAAHALRRGYSM